MPQFLSEILKLYISWLFYLNVLFFFFLLLCIDGNIHTCIHTYIHTYTYMYIKYTNLQSAHFKIYFKVAATSWKLEIRPHAHQVGTNTWSGTEVIFTLIWLACAFGATCRLICSLISGLNDGAATLTHWALDHIKMWSGTITLNRFSKILSYVPKEREKYTAKNEP